MTTQQQFTISSHWAITRTADGIQINAGDDMIYEVVCDTITADFFCGRAESFKRIDLPATSLTVFEQLLSAEVIIPAIPTPKISPTRVNVVTESSSACKHISITLKEKGYNVTPVKPDITLVVRTAKSLSEFLKKIKYQDLTSVHLFVDLAYHHTISIGPLVFPGDTPCIACLEGRLLSRWGSQALPPQPNAKTTLLGLALELADLEITRYAQGDTTLAFKTVAYDTDQRSVETYKLLTVPQCPYCMNANAYANGSLVI